MLGRGTGAPMGRGGTAGRGTRRGPNAASKRWKGACTRRPAVAEVGAGREDVIRTRMFVTDISRWQEFGRAHGEVFAAHPPATSMVEVKALIDPAMLIEIEADAIAP